MERPYSKKFIARLGQFFNEQELEEALEEYNTPGISKAELFRKLTSSKGVGKNYDSGEREESVRSGHSITKKRARKKKH